MVNFVEAQMPLLHFLTKQAGLRPFKVEIEPGTVMSFWVPKHKLNKKKCATNIEIGSEVQTSNTLNPKDTIKKKNKKERPAVVLLHGFAADGIVTWQLQIGALSKKYDVYVPDLLFFGGSKTTLSDRSPRLQAGCLITALDLLGVQNCTVVGFSYGGMIAFKMAEMKPELIKNLVVSGSVISVTDSIRDAMLKRLDMKSFAEMLMPETVKGLKALRSISMYRKIWIPIFLFKDFLQAMFDNKKERAELLEGLAISNKDATVPILPQRILLLWGENDNVFDIQHAKDIKQQLGEEATIQSIDKAGHLVHIERPCQYNRHLKEFLANVTTRSAIDPAKK